MIKMSEINYVYIRSLSGVNLQKAVLHNMRLPWVDLSEANLMEARFSELNLINANKIIFN